MRTIKTHKMLENTTQETQVMGSGGSQWKARPKNDTGIVSTQDKTTMEEWVTAERGNVMVAGDRHVKSSTATTVSTESKQTGNSSNVHTSSDNLEQQTDPTSSPSEMLDEPDRKYTESPIDSDRAVYGSNSVHSDSSDSSAEHSDLKKKNMTTAADLEKVGGQFDESCTTGREAAASFHNPANDVEANYINDKVIKANSEHFKLAHCMATRQLTEIRSYNGGHLPSSRSTFSRSRILVPSLRETQRACRTGS